MQGMYWVPLGPLLKPYKGHYWLITNFVGYYLSTFTIVWKLTSMECTRLWLRSQITLSLSGLLQWQQKSTRGVRKKSDGNCHSSKIYKSEKWVIINQHVYMCVLYNLYTVDCLYIVCISCTHLNLWYLTSYNIRDDGRSKLLSWDARCDHRNISVSSIERYHFPVAHSMCA